MSLYDILMMIGYRADKARAIAVLTEHGERVSIERQCAAKSRYTEDEFEVLELSRHIRGGTNA